MKKKVLIFLKHYTPGVKAGGPIRSIEGIAYHLKDKFDIYVYTSDRDFGDREPYKNIETDKWIQFEDCKVYYSSRKKKINELAKLINSFDFDKIYLNGTFPYEFSIKILLISKLHMIKNKIIVAPRGEFSPGALDIKKKKKKIYLYLSKIIGLFSNVEWHASSEIEKRDILNIYNNANVKIALNLSKPSIEVKKTNIKEKGKVKLIFLSRICEKKNLKFALKVLKEVKSDIIYDIYGPIEDRQYWDECLELISELPNNITVTYKGEVPNNEVVNVMAMYDFLFFPTMGENFGHVIKESLNAGTPIIISDQTPWRDLENEKVGFDIIGFDIEKYVKVVEKVASFNESEYKEFSSRTVPYINNIINDKKMINDMIKVFS